MKIPIIYFIFAIAFLCVLMYSCVYHKADLLSNDSRYPPHIESILVHKCATSGCHNLASNQNAGGLNLSNWGNLFEGSAGGAVVIPFRPDFSTLCYYTNTDTGKGLVLLPTMPVNGTPLNATEYSTLSQWILNGAPDKQGFVKFSDFETKAKLYICNRGCDVVTVMDPASGLAMRYIDVGVHTDIEGPCMVKVSPDKMHWYVIFNQGTRIQKFRTSDNHKVGELEMGSGIWTSLVISSDSKFAFVSDATFQGRILYLNLQNMQLIKSYVDNLRFPYGLCINQSNQILYATSREGNMIYKINISDPQSPLIQEISLEPGMPPSGIPTLNPYFVLMNPDESKYYVTCHKSSEIRILETTTDSVLAIIPTGSNPAEMVYSSAHHYLFLSCLGVPGTGKKSVINVFNTITGSFLPEIYAGHDSKGIALDEASGKLFVANRNVTEGGPAAHHAPLCAGKNGYITAIDLNTLIPVAGYKAELSVEPYAIGK